MKIMYIFPHPDDESFGPGAAIHRQIQEGNEVFLLTMTKGGATKVRHQLGLSIKEMGELRVKEMLDVKAALGISEMAILDFEDGGLSRINPQILEDSVAEWIEKFSPEIVVTYPVHGGSGHHDHIAIHHIVRRLYYESDLRFSFWKRLAYFTVIDTGKPMFMDGGVPRVIQTKPEHAMVEIRLDTENIDKMKEALSCYGTYQEMVKTTNVIERIGDKTYYELEAESFEKPLNSITAGIGKAILSC